MSVPDDTPGSLDEEEAELLVTTDEEESLEINEFFPEDEYEDEDDRSDGRSLRPSLKNRYSEMLGEDGEEEEDFDETEEEGAEEGGGKGRQSEAEQTASEGESHTLEFLKKPFGDIDDFMEEDEEESMKPKGSIDVLEIKDLTREEAVDIAEYVLELLEEDLADYVERTGTKFPPPLTAKEKERMKRRQQMGIRSDDSISSYNSSLSEILPGEPSKIRMTYEKGVSVFADLSLMHLAADEMVDAECQVNLHRTRKKTPTKKYCRYAQTLEMTFIPAETAGLLFRQFYPQMDDYKVEEPPSRQASEDLAIRNANEADPNIDNRRKGPEIVHLSNKKQLLQPLMDDYFKDEKMCTGSRFIGEYRSRQFFKGRYDHPTGTTIESEFVNGHFENQKHLGIVKYPRGDKFEGNWRRGRYQSGQITFCDGLKFSNTDWRYCEPPDRRFKVERYYGIKPAGMTLFSDNFPPPSVPPGTYDVGDGYYDPKTGDVRGYDGFLLRQATQAEVYWLERNCRKVHDTMEHIAPKFLPERIPGSFVDGQKRLPLTKKRYH